MPTKEVKEISINYCQNPEIAEIHTRKKLSKTINIFSDEITLSEKEEIKGLKPGVLELTKSLFRLKGVQGVTVQAYELQIEKAQMYQWKEIMPKIEALLKKFLLKK